MMLGDNNNFKTPKEVQSFIERYNEQRKEDQATLKLYAERQKEVKAKLSKRNDVGDVAYVKKALKSNVPKKLDFNISTLGGV